VTPSILPRLLAVVALGFSSLALAASPTVDDVYQATRSGRIAEAEAMMQQVLAEHPDSATAHFVSAEVEYRAGKLDRARAELAKAEQLSPGLPKMSPRAVAELRAGLSGSGMVRADRVPRSGGSGIPWVPILLLGGAVLLVIVLIRRQRQTVMMPPGGGFGPGMGPNGGMGGPTPMGGPGYGYGYGPGVMNQGSGIMGSVASGLAVGAGIVAGEALARRVFEPGHPDYVEPSQQAYVDPNNDLGGNDFGVSGGWDDGGGGGFSDGGGGGDWS